MTLTIGVPKEIAPGERRVALVPDAVRALRGRKDAQIEVWVESGAGRSAGFTDEAYEMAGAQLVDAARAFDAQVVVKVQPPTERPGAGSELDSLHEGTAYVGFLRPLDDPALAGRLAARKVDAFSLELMPRITRAQSMDALSSMSTLAGYRAVLLAALTLPRIFPMLVTAAGTLQPARVFVIGAGVAGLQALGTARRLGAVTEAYDTRPAVREQVESLGARFVELPLETGDAQDAGGYAKAQSEDFYRRQRELLAQVVARSDVVITTALVPGQRAPVLIEEAAVARMAPGSVIVDLAAEKGGNCACTRADQTVVAHGVTVLGPTNLPSEVPYHASQMYAKNLTTFLQHLVKDGTIAFDLEDEITSGALLTYRGEVHNARVKGLLAAGNA
jgi:NAD(P) transhydrogenase subunit alpha